MGQRAQERGARTRQVAPGVGLSLRAGDG